MLRFDYNLFNDLLINNVFLNKANHSKKQVKVKEQHVIRMDMDVNKHERLSNITLRNKLK